MPRERREEAESTLRDFSTRWPKTPVVVTSRPIGYRRPGSEFVELDLLAFDEGQRREFLSRWFGRSTVGRAGSKTESRKVNEVMKVLRGDASLWDLSGNPLYLTLMALLFEEDNEPDRNRATLYDQVFDLLLDGRHRPEGRPIAAKKAVHALLRRLSHDMTRDNRDAEPKAEIEARLYQDEYDDLRKPLEKDTCLAAEPGAVPRGPLREDRDPRSPRSDRWHVLVLRCQGSVRVSVLLGPG